MVTRIVIAIITMIAIITIIAVIPIIYIVAKIAIIAIHPRALPETKRPYSHVHQQIAEHVQDNAVAPSPCLAFSFSGWYLPFFAKNMCLEATQETKQLAAKFYNVTYMLFVLSTLKQSLIQKFTRVKLLYNDKQLDVEIVFYVASRSLYPL